MLVDQIRAVGTYYTLKSHAGGPKITIIKDADTMNQNAANALLKVLEEPPPGALIMLLAASTGSLPQTILSRCQRLELRVSDPAVVDRWLEQQCAGPALERLRQASFSGAPLRLLAQLESEQSSPIDALAESLVAGAGGRANTIELAASVTSDDHDLLLSNLDLLVRVMLLAKVGNELPRLYLTDKTSKTLREIANKLNSKRLFLFLDHISDARAMLRRSSGVRAADVIENLFYQWAQLAHMENRQ